MRIDRPQIPTSKLLVAAVRGSKTGYFRANNDDDHGPSSPSKSSRATDVRRPLLLDVKDLEHSKPIDCGLKKTKAKTKKVVAKKISPPSPSQRSIKRGVVARRIDAIENGEECDDDDDDDDDDSRYLLSSTKSANVNTSIHQPKKSLLGFRLGSPRNNDAVSSTFISTDLAVKSFGTRILQQNYYRNVDEKNDEVTEVVDLGGFDVLGAVMNYEDENEDEAVATSSSDKENDDKSLIGSSSGIDIDGCLTTEGKAEDSSHCEVKVADADTILADLADSTLTIHTDFATDIDTTPGNNANVVVANKEPSLHTPIEDSVVTTTTTEMSCVTNTTKYSNYHRVDKEKPFHVTVTPTEDGDVILLSASTDLLSALNTATMDSTFRKDSKLLIPSLGGRYEANDADDNDKVEQVVPELQGKRKDEEMMGEEVQTNVNITPVEPETRKKFVSFSNEDKETSSPTGVDELDLYEEVETSTQEIGGSTSDDFIANEGWEEEDDSNTFSSTLSRPFGSFEVHEDAMRDNRRISTIGVLQQQHQGHQHLENHHVIELRHSMESDCDGESQSSSSYLDGADLIGSDTQSIELKQLSEGGDDGDVEEEEDRDEVDKDNKMSIQDAECEDNKGKGTRLGAFSQIYTREGQLPDGEESDSECDESDECDDHNSVCSTKEFESIRVLTDGTPESSEIETTNGDDIEETSMKHLGSNKPWALAECDSVSVYSGADLLSVPSKESLASNNDQEIAPSSSSSMLSADPHSVSTGDRDHENFESLNTYWVREWTDAVAKLTTEAEDRLNSMPCKESLVENITHEPRLLLKRDVGNAMSDDDNELDTGTKCNNICSDGEGNQYLKIYDIDTCTNVYEVIQLSGLELETVVEECSSEEDGEGVDDGMSNDNHRDEKSLLLERLLEDTVEFEMQKMVGSQHKEYQAVAPTLEELQRIFDEYQAAQCNQLNGSAHTPLSPSTLTSFRSVKSTKKRHVHIKRRAIAKAKAEKTKYDLVYVEKGSHRDKSLHTTVLKSYSNASHSSLQSNISLDDSISKTIHSIPELPHEDEDKKLSIDCDASTIDEAQNDGKKVITTKEEHSMSSSESFEYCGVPINCDIPEQEEQTSGIELMNSIEEDNSLGLGSNMSLDGIISNAIRTMPEFLFEDKDYELAELGDDIEDETSLASGISLDTISSETNGHKLRGCAMTTIQGQPGVNEGASSVLAKLYDENNELAESLAAVQRELENVNRKLAVVTHERDEVMSSARIEV